MKYNKGDKIAVKLVWKSVDGEIKIKHNEVFTVVDYDERYGWVRCEPRPEVTLSNVFHIENLRRVG